MSFTLQQFLKAVNAVLSKKDELALVADIVSKFILSVLAAYDAAKFGTYSRAVPDEDAMAIIEAMGREEKI